MSRTSAVTSRRLLMTALLIVAAAGPQARAQPDDRPEKSVPTTGIHIPDSDGPEARKTWESRLSTEVDRIDRTCRLGEAQRKKLVLAGCADIKRSLDSVEDARTRLRAAQARKEPSGATKDELTALQRRFQAGLFRDGSMFAKTLPRVLDAGQLAAYGADVAARRRFRHRARVDLAVEVFHAAVGCNDVQREKLADLLLERTRLARRPDQDFTVVLAQAAALPKAALRPIFDDQQWPAVSRLLDQLGAELKNELRGAELEPADAAGPVAARDGANAPGAR